MADQDQQRTGAAAEDQAEPPQQVEASRRADEALSEQRDAHEPRADLPQPEVVDEGVGALVNNTGLDGDAASG